MIKVQQKSENNLSFHQTLIMDVQKCKIKLYVKQNVLLIFLQNITELSLEDHKEREKVFSKQIDFTKKEIIVPSKKLRKLGRCFLKLLLLVVDLVAVFETGV